MSSINNDNNNWQSAYTQEQQQAEDASNNADGSTASTATRQRAGQQQVLLNGQTVAQSVNPNSITSASSDTVNVGGVRRNTAMTNGGNVTTGAPDLPDTDGGKASSKQVATAVDGGSLSINGMAWAAMQAMTNGTQQEFTQQSREKIFADKAKTDAKEEEIKDTKDQIQGQREASVNNFMGSLAGTGASAFLGFRGAQKQLTNSGKDMTSGAMYQAMGNTAGQAVTQGVKALDTTEGGQYQADQASVRIKEDQMMGDIWQQVSDASNTFVTQAQQDRQTAQQGITDMVQRQMQASNNIANG